jgi:hypothetical protein
MKLGAGLKVGNLIKMKRLKIPGSFLERCLRKFAVRHFTMSYENLI